MRRTFRGLITITAFNVFHSFALLRAASRLRVRFSENAKSRRCEVARRGLLGLPGLVRLCCIGAMMVLCCRPALGWSAKEHMMLSRLAARNLINDPATPQGMKDFLSHCLKGIPDLAAEEKHFMTAKVGKDPRGFEGIEKYSYQPDIHQFYDKRNTRVEPFGVHERLLHFIDLELFLSGDAKRGYQDDLSGKPKMEAIPNDMKDPRYQQAGMLPIRVEYCYGKLVAAIREKRIDNPQPLLEDEPDSAIRWAGYLAHYVEDNTQPHHSTLDYKSQSYFKVARKAPNAHNEVEFRMVDDEVEEFPQLRADYWAMFMKALSEAKDPVQTDDLFRATLEVASTSYDNLPLIGAAAVHAHVPVEGNSADKIDTEKFFRFEGTVNGKPISVMQMKANQQAWAVKRVERVWRKAWREAVGE